jgi:hypothetical protein
VQAWQVITISTPSVNAQLIKTTRHIVPATSIEKRKAMRSPENKNRRKPKGKDERDGIALGKDVR